MTGEYDRQNYLYFALKLADESRQIILSNIKSTVSENHISFESKEDQSPVTKIDQEVERKLRSFINQEYPEHGCLGEEQPPLRLEAEFVWVIDPVDGTKAFITGLPVYSTLIALCYQGKPFLGVMDFPATKERIWALDGHSCLFDGSPCRARPLGPEPIMAITNPEALSQKEREAVSAIRKEMNFAVYGGSSYVYGQLARGRLDLAIDSGLDPFDYCAVDVVIRVAGGVMTDWEGQPLTIKSGNRVLAVGDAKLHEKTLKIIQQYI
jgi:histidinol phosphatase-like enzyme (inositol monophosphatase family)